MSVSVESSAGVAPIPAAPGPNDRFPAGHLPARRTLAARPSEVRKVFRAAQRPGIISFANGAQAHFLSTESRRTPSAS